MRPPRLSHGLALVALLLGSFALNAWGLSWGLPSRHGWAPDEVLPGDVLEARARGFRDGWHSKYPPLHYYLLAALFSATPETAARALPATGHATPVDPVLSDLAYEHLFVRSRAGSLVMAAGVLVAVYLSARLLTTPRAALFAAALVATLPPFGFYAKLANVDVPSLFWWSWSLFFLLRTLRDHRLPDYLGLAATAAAAVATKDQMYGLYVLCIPWLLASHARRTRSMPPEEHARGAFGRNFAAAAATVVVLLILLYGVPWNPAGVRAHFALITGSASQDFREFAGTAGGQLALVAQTAANLAFVLGVPALVTCLAGVAVGARRASGFPPSSLLLPALSYYVFFLMAVLYSYDRFVLPIAILLAFFGGASLDWLWNAPRWRPAGRTAVAAILFYGVGRSVSLDLSMTNDARYAAEAWLKANAALPGVVAPVGPLEYLPRMAGLDARPLGPSVDRLARVKPQFVVVSADYAERDDPGTGPHALYAGLEAGTLGYRRVFDHRYDAPFLLLRTEELLDRPGAVVRSNIGKVNPRIRIYERETAP